MKTAAATKPEADYSALAPRVGASPELLAIEQAHARREYVPDLIAALEAVLSMHCMPTEPHRTYRDSIGAMDQARAAVAKARSLGAK